MEKTDEKKQQQETLPLIVSFDFILSVHLPYVIFFSVCYYFYHLVEAKELIGVPQPGLSRSFLQSLLDSKLQLTAVVLPFTKTYAGKADPSYAFLVNR